jgi:hypothetical protein
MAKIRIEKKPTEYRLLRDEKYAGKVIPGQEGKPAYVFTTLDNYSPDELEEMATELRKIPYEREK